MMTPQSTPTPCVFPFGSSSRCAPTSAKSWIDPTAAAFVCAQPSLGTLLPQAACIRLELEDLPRFATVERQFADRGIQFRNAVAIHPSNPAYPPHSGMIVLLAAPKSGWLEAIFRQPMQYVSGYITSSRRTILRAFDRQNQLIAQTSSPGPNLAGLHRYAPNLKLCIEASGIYRVTFDSSNGELTLDDFEFYVQ
ncbi:MAG: hypothetical protein IGS50_04500 [Synechococcales cyanobacterium C42_A2020_086]|nr:hypothetical protein [Synechococcales cyanobacterium C42_A2020_086]